MTKDQKQVSDIRSNKQVFSWTSSEFTYHPKTKSWYISVIVIALILLGIFYWKKMSAAIAVIVASVLALFMQAGLKPKNIKYTINTEGIKFQNKSYSFDEFKSFSIIGGLPPKKLYLSKTGKFFNPIIIELNNISPEIVREFLQQYLPEDHKQGEYINERISRFIRF